MNREGRLKDSEGKEGIKVTYFPMFFRTSVPSVGLREKGWDGRPMHRGWHRRGGK